MSLLEEMQAAGIKPENKPKSTQKNNYNDSGYSSGSLLEEMQAAGIKPENFPADYSDSQPQKSEGFLKSIVKSVARPFAEVGTSAYNVGSSISHLAKGDVAGADKALYQSRNVPFLGETKPAFNQEDVNQKGVY
jgi:hypothetical protein